MYDNKATAWATRVAKLLCLVTAALALLRVLGLAPLAWGWVLAPLWAPAALLLFFYLLSVVIDFQERRKK